MMNIDISTLKDTYPQREWLETDSRGGYASSTLTNLHTRKYHGLYVAGLEKPEGRYVLLSKLEDSLVTGGNETHFTSHRYPGVLFPPDLSHYTEFSLDHFPVFTYRDRTTSVRKSIMLPAGNRLLLVRYDIDKCPKGGILRLKPFTAFRGYHELSHENEFLQSSLGILPNGFSMSPYAGMPEIFFQTSRLSEFIPTAIWYQRFQYEEEINRGFSGEEDLYLPGIINVPVERKCTVILCVSLFAPVRNFASLWQTETVRRGRERTIDRQCVSRTKEEDRDLHLALVRDGRHFLITTPSGRPSIIAGYPWFGSWSRDSLISLPGLCFRTGRLKEGIDILTEIGSHEQYGFLPNFFSADGKPEAYNTIDSSLWFFWAVQELLAATGDSELIQTTFWPVMKRIIAAFMNGTRFKTYADTSGLLHSGDSDTALTWMDATVGGRPVTSRHGCAVEINALWYNALNFSQELADRFGEPELFDRGFIPHLRTAFQETFWNMEENCLGDVFNEDGLDRKIRPNQIFAVSLPFSPLDDEQQKGVVRAVRKHLLTPVGLRTLSPDDSSYRSRYRGNPAERDSAYHQGTVWPWLLGAFGQAALRTADNKEEVTEQLRNHLRAFLVVHLSEAGIGSVSEVFDAEPPHAPGGCIAQAWSVAELTRLYFLLDQD